MGLGLGLGTRNTSKDIEIEVRLYPINRGFNRNRNEVIALNVTTKETCI
jgi:hypothetical protein